MTLSHMFSGQSALNVTWKSRVIDREFRVISVFYLYTKLNHFHIFLLTLIQNQQKDYESIAILMLESCATKIKHHLI